MNIWKTLKMAVAGLALACGLALMAPPAAQAQFGGEYSVTSLSATNRQTAANTNSLPLVGNVINATVSKEVALLIGAELMASGTSTSIWTFAYSINGSTNFQTHGADSPFTIVLTHTDTTPDYFVTNITVGAKGYLRLQTIGNNGTAALTNVIVRYATKPGF